MTDTLQANKINYFIKQKHIIQDVSLSIKNDGITGFLGPNGAGKTTFFHILAGINAAHSGNIKINNTDITKLATHKRLAHGIAFLPQNSSIFQHMSVEKNILSGLDYTTNLNFTEKQNLLEKSLNNFSLQKIRKSMGISLSGGERRRVELARCLIMKPKFILLDEPFSGIDPITVKETQKIFKEIINQGTGILISDHNANETMQICNSIYLLYNGKILTHDTPKNLATNSLAQSFYFGENL